MRKPGLHRSRVFLLRCRFPTRLRIAIHCDSYIHIHHHAEEVFRERDLQNNKDDETCTEGWEKANRSACPA